jgi:hypothetical protein
MTHDLLVQLAHQRQTRLAARAEWERRTSPTRPAAPATTRRTAPRRPLAALAALVGRA